MLGYFPDNELNWAGTDKRSNSLLDWFLLRVNSTPGRTAARSFLQARYNGSISELNRAWAAGQT